MNNLTTNPERKGKTSPMPLPYQETGSEFVKVYMHEKKHITTLPAKCQGCGLEHPKAGFAPAFAEIIYGKPGNPQNKLILLCWTCWWAY